MIVLFFILFISATTRLYAQQEQDFTLKPVDTNVVIGNTVVLKCSVTAKHGDVQWTHDGTALGYDRKVPGKPRFTVTWIDNEEQEYHLKIVNVTIDDEGTYACQVAPIGDWDTKLEAKAKLVVLVAPTTKTEITFNEEAKNNNEIIHIRESAIKSSKFVCKLRKSKPVGQIKWYLNGTQVTSALATIADVVTKDSYLEDITSTLEFKPTTQFNNSLLKCQAFHLAYGLNVEVANISASLRLVVVYPPSVPQISGYDTANGVIAGTFLKLTCTSTHRFPPAKLTWYKNKAVLSTNYGTIESKTESEVQFKVDPADNQASYKCDAINQAIDAPLSSEVKLNVLFGPANVALSGQFEVKTGETIIGTCTADSANPPAKIRFVFDGFEYEPTTQSVTASTNNGSIVNATFIRSVSREHNGKELKCLVENKAANIQRVMSKTINILYPPESIELIYPEENKVVVEGRTVRLVCRIKGGNPNADIEWYIGSGSSNSLLTRTKLSALTTQTFVTSTESTLELLLKREYHNQPVECIATNKVATLKRSVNMSVSYLPMPNNVKISLVVPQAAPAKAGTRVLLACNAANSNPAPTISWFKDSYAVQYDSTNEIRSNITSKLSTNDYETVSYVEFVASSNDHNKEVRCDVAVTDIPRLIHASYMLNIAFAPEIIKPPASVIDVNENSTFTFNLTARANPAPTYSCSASNGKTYAIQNLTLLQFVTTKQDNAEFKCLLTNSEGTTEVKFRLNVKFAASVSTNSSTYTVTKGDALNLFCNINANPLELSHIEWKLNSKNIPSNDPRFQSRLELPNLAVLTVHNVKDTEDGNFSCHVNNKIGTAATISMRVFVKRGPTIFDDSVLKAAQDSNEGRSARFICRVQAYPDVAFKWKFANNSDITNSTKHTIVNAKQENSQIASSTLLINVVVSTDYGIYICEAKNDIGIQTGKAVLGGKHQPESPSDFRVLNITRNSIQLAWKKNFDGGDAQRFRIRYRKDTIDPTYKYVETASDQSTILLDNLEMATRYIINIQSLNQFGSEGYLREPLVVQTDFGFNDVNQMPIYTGNDLPLTIILVVCGVGTLLLLFNVILIIYFIRKRKRKGETDSTTGTNETDANTIEMFTPPPPYPDELNYQLELSPNLYEDENKPFVPQTIKYIKKIPNSDNEYSVEYATPMQSWNDGANNELLSDDIYVPTFRGDGYVRARAYPYETICNQSNIRLGDIERLTIKPSMSNTTSNCIYSSNSNNNQQGKIYQSLDEFKGHLV